MRGRAPANSIRGVRSGPSLTARVVALARSELARPQAPGGDPGAEQRLHGGLRTPVLKPVARVLHGWLKARTEFFDDATLDALWAGIDQIVIVGAGYDGRALRFAHPGVRFFEIDHPATQTDKRRRVEEAGAAGDRVVYIPHDLAQGSLARALAEAGHASDRPSLFICEGLLLYLALPLTEELLRALYDCGAPESRLALSAHELDPRRGLVDKARIAGQRAVLAAIGEPRRLLLEPGELAAVLERTGWRPFSERVRSSGGRRGMLVTAERT